MQKRNSEAFPTVSLNCGNELRQGHPSRLPPAHLIRCERSFCLHKPQPRKHHNAGTQTCRRWCLRVDVTLCDPPTCRFGAGVTRTCTIGCGAQPKGMAAAGLWYGDVAGSALRTGYPAGRCDGRGMDTGSGNAKFRVDTPATASISEPYIQECAQQNLASIAIS